MFLTVSCRGESAAAFLGEVQYAKSQPVTEERIRQQMDKLGNTPFVWEGLDIQMGESIFVPMKTLNEARHQALEELQEKLLEKYRRDKAEKMIEAERKPEESASSTERSASNYVSYGVEGAIPVYASCETDEAAEILCREKGIQGIYLPYLLMEKYLQAGLSQGKEMYLSLPHITRGNPPKGYLDQIQKWLKEGMTGLLVRNLESYSRLAELGFSEKCVLDHSLYTWNDEAIHFWKNQKILRNTVPLELNEKELRHRENAGSEVIVYGRLPLMHSAQCVRKNTTGCNRPGGQAGSEGPL